MTKSTITRERLEQLADNNTICKVSWDERIELAQIVLAAMDSEPVAEVVSIYGDPEAFGEREIRPLVGIQQMPYGTKLYRHAQQPVVPDEIKHRIGGLDWGWEGEFNRGWNACRAAMLAAAPQPQSAQQNIPEIIPGWIPVSELMPDCWCRTCRPVAINDMRFVVCPDCGNKRCPRANDHRNACTGSNEPGQEGSAYPDIPREVK
ncbi:hypothetical protein ACM2MW_003744 [Klebsiella pneumoniae]